MICWISCYRGLGQAASLTNACFRIPALDLRARVGRAVWALAFLGPGDLGWDGKKPGLTGSCQLPTPSTQGGVTMVTLQVVGGHHLRDAGWGWNLDIVQRGSLCVTDASLSPVCVLTLGLSCLLMVYSGDCCTRAFDLSLGNETAV